jgi:hypothetical protein
VEDNRIMLTELSLMVPKQRALFEKKQAIIHQRDM